MIDSEAHIVQVGVSGGGLPKHSVAQAWIGPEGVAGDRHRHPQIHGGPLQAVLLVCAEVVDELIGRGYPLFYGALGENLTVRGLDRRAFRAGHRYRIGADLVIELTKPRGPCRALDVYHADLKSVVYDSMVKAKNPQSPVWGMSGFYASVLCSGIASSGDTILLD